MKEEFDPFGKYSDIELRLALVTAAKEAYQKEIVDTGIEHDVIGLGVNKAASSKIEWLIQKIGSWIEGKK